ncbi:RNA polymerase sigma factor [Streptomyces lavendulae]
MDLVSLKEAFEEFWRYHGLIRRVLVRKGVRDSAAEDLVSRIGMRYATHRCRHEVANPAAYLTTMANSTVADYMREQQRYAEVLIGDDWSALTLPDHERSAEDTVAERIRNIEVLLKVKSLPVRQREVIVLVYFLGLSLPEVAEQLGVTHDTVRRYRSRALDTLRELLQPLASAEREGGRR